MFKLFWILIFLLNGFLSAHALNESTQSVTLDGVLYKKNTTTPITDSSVSLRIQILNPAGTCLLYEETQTVNTSSTKGYFSIQVGSNTGSVKRTGSDPGRTMAQVFQNTVAITGNDVTSGSCSGNSYIPTAGDVRYFRVTVTPSATMVADTLTPDIVMDSVPQAIVAQSVQGLERANILAANTSGTISLTQANLESAFTGTAWTNLQSILNGNFLRTDTSGATLPAYASNPAGVSIGDMWYDSTTNEIKYQSNAGVQALGAVGVVSGGSITSGTISGTTAWDTTGNVTTTGVVTGATLTGTNVQATNLRVFNGAQYVQLTAQAMSTSYSLALPTADGVSGQVMATNGAGVLNWITPSGGVAGTISVGQGGTAATAFSASRIIASNVTGTALESFSCSLNQVISFDASGNATCANVGSGNISNGGNSTGAAISIGTNDNQAFQLKANNTTALTISQNGNVGIGTTNPSSTLSVVAVNGVDAPYQSFSVSGGNAQPGSTGAGISLAAGYGDGNAAASGAVLYLNGGGFAGGGLALRAGNSGGGGGQPLTIAGANGGNSGNQTGGSVTINGGNATGSYSGGAVSIVGGNAGTNGNGASVFIDGGALGGAGANGNIFLGSVRGNVGIGTTTPLAKLHVMRGSDRGLIVDSSSSGQDSNIVVSRAGVEYGVIASFASSNDFKVASKRSTGKLILSGGNGGTNDVIIDSVGLVGIGTESPSSAFDISGALTAQGLSSAPSLSPSQAGRIYFDYATNKFRVSENGGAYQDLIGTGGSVSGAIVNGGNSTGAAISIGTNDNHALQLMSNSTIAMTISQSGNVGIGVTSPLTKLDVRAADNTTIASFGNTVNSATTEIRSIGAGQSQYLAFKRTNGAYDQLTINPPTGSDSYATIAAAGPMAFQAETQGGGPSDTTATGMFDFSSIGALTSSVGLNSYLFIKPKINQSGTAGYNGVYVDVTETATGSGEKYILNLASNGMSKMVVGSAGNVGIGTATPISNFHVHTTGGNAGMDLSFDDETQGRASFRMYTQRNSGAAAFDGTNNKGWTIQTYGNSGFFGGNSGDLVFIQNQNSNPAGHYSLLKLDSAEFRVGIGRDTASVPSTLFVKGSDSSVSEISFIIDRGMSSTTGDLTQWRTQGGSSVLSAVNKDGWFGIGLSGPSSAVDISGSFTAQGLSLDPAVSPLRAGRIFFDYATNKFRVSENGGAYQDLVGTGGSVSGAIVNGGNTTGAAISIGTNDNYAFSLKANDATAMTISGNGNVGIGAITPINKLDVSGGVAIGSYSGVNSAPGNGLIVSGIVAVGTATPSYKLDVQGQSDAAYPYIISRLRLRNSTGASDRGNIAFGATDVPGSNSGFIEASDSTSSGLAFRTRNGAGTDYRMVINNSGNVGIGTTNPSTLLEVKKTGPGTIFATSNFSDNKIFEVATTGGAENGAFYLRDGSNNLRVASYADSSTGPTLYLDPNATLGDDPGTGYGGALFIKSPQVVNQQNGVFFVNSSNTSLEPGAALTFFTSDIGDHNVGGLNLKTRSTAGNLLTRMTIDSSGNVGIGISTPSEKLEVTGNVKVNGRFLSSVSTDADALAALTVDFASTNTVRATAASAACGTLNVTNTSAGGNYTVTILNATSSCSTIQWNGSATNVKLPSSYSGGAAVTGIVYNFIDDGATLWVSAVPF